MRTIELSIIVNARVLEAHIHFLFMYTTDHIFLVLPIKYMINEYSDLTTPCKLATGTKPSLSHLRVLFCPCVLQNATASVDKKALKMRHQVQKGFRGIFAGIPHHQKGYLVYVPSTRKIIYSYNIVFDKNFSALAYKSRPYSKVMAVRSSVTYTPSATSSREQTGDIITFVHFEEGDLLSENRNDTESGDESYEDSIIPPPSSKEEMDAMDSSDDLDDDPISTDMLENIRDRS